MPIQIFNDNGSDQLVKKDVIEAGCWVRIYSPTNEELESLHLEANLPLDFLHDPLDDDEGSRLETKNDCTLIIIRTPLSIAEEVNEINYEAVPFGIILKGDTIFTISKDKIKVLSDYVRFGDFEISIRNKKSMILKLLENTSRLYLSALKKMNEKHDKIERKMIDSKEVDYLIELQNLKKSLVYFTTSIKNNISVLNKLKRNVEIVFDEDELDLVEDVLVDMRQALEISEIYMNIIVGTLNTFTSMISNDISSVMKVLTSVTIVLMIPTLITSIYGMNVHGMPLHDDPNAFWILLGICAFISAFFSILFFKKNWFRR